MNRSSGEKPPVARSSKSQSERGESWIEGKRAALALASRRSSSPAERSTRWPPYGAIRFGVAREAVGSPTGHDPPCHRHSVPVFIWSSQTILRGSAASSLQISGTNSQPSPSEQRRE